MLGPLGPLEIATIFIVSLVAFLPKRFPAMGKGLGQGLREFQKSIADEKRDTTDDGDRS